MFSPAEGVKLIDQLGLDAISAYANPCGQENHEMPYPGLAALNRAFWDGCKAVGKQFIPTVNAGWDYRPEKDRGFPYRDPKSGWFTPPAPAELAQHLEAALRWTKENAPVCPANTVLIYAWNEFNEGGWLTPTLREGAARLDAIAEMLKKFGNR